MEFGFLIARYQQDPSLLIGIPDAGIKMQPFNYTSRVNREGKSFSISELFYGEEGNVRRPPRPSAIWQSATCNSSVLQTLVLLLYSLAPSAQDARTPSKSPEERHSSSCK